MRRFSLPPATIADALLRLPLATPLMQLYADDAAMIRDAVSLYAHAFAAERMPPPCCRFMPDFFRRRHATPPLQAAAAERCC